jgi:hypothetical protein
LGQNQRRAWWWRVRPYLGSGGGRPDAIDLELEMEQDPYGGPVPGISPSDKDLKKLREEAYRNGVRDGTSGMYDEWSPTGSRPPYLMMVDAKCRETKAEERVRQLRDAQRLDERIAAAKRDLKRHTERADRLQAELDGVTTTEKELQEVLNGTEESRHPGLRWAEATRSLNRRRRSTGARAFVLALFAAVELPIQYATFVYFGESPEMTWAFVLGTVGAMLVAPHLAGGWVRRMTIEGRRSALAPATAVVLVAWATAVGLLALLRTSVLFAPGFDNATLQTVKSTIDSLGLGRTTVSILFGALLTLSGVVTFTYGFLSENPYAAKLADLQRERRKLENALSKAAGQRDRDQYLVGLEKTLITRHGERWEARIAARGNAYEVCTAVYLQAVAGTMRNPAFTESASLWLRADPAHQPTA